jgi:hypothetical protein
LVDIDCGLRDKEHGHDADKGDCTAMDKTYSDKIDAALANLEIGLRELKDWRAGNVKALLAMGPTAISDLRLFLDDLWDAIEQADYAEVGGLN